MQTCAVVIKLVDSDSAIINGNANNRPQVIEH